MPEWVYEAAMFAVAKMLVPCVVSVGTFVATRHYYEGRAERQRQQSRDRTLRLLNYELAQAFIGLSTIVSYESLGFVPGEGALDLPILRQFLPDLVDLQQDQMEALYDVYYSVQVAESVLPAAPDLQVGETHPVASGLYPLLRSTAAKVERALRTLPGGHMAMAVARAKIKAQPDLLTDEMGQAASSPE